MQPWQQLAYKVNFRRLRMARVFEYFGLSRDSRVLDLGGCSQIWTVAPFVPNLTIVNCVPLHGDEPLDREVCNIVADATKLPFADQSFDLVFCNSLIEHLDCGGKSGGQKRLADEIQRVGRHYFVQTPNRHFPLDLHTMLPFFHWLPRPMQRRLAPFSPFRFISKCSPEEAADLIGDLHLLTAGELQRLFPNGHLRRERFLGIVKSLEIYR